MNDNKEEIYKLISGLKDIQDYFSQKYDQKDIFSGSKFYEMIIANQLGHEMIPGQAGTKDGRDENGEYEYKHYKESSSNHSWTFNDYSDATIEGLKNIKSAIFAHIDDSVFPPKLDWYIEVDGNTCSDYLKQRTESLLAEMPKGKVNARKMINFSSNQLEKDLGLTKTQVKEVNQAGLYYNKINEISTIAQELEKLTGIDQILTSDKIWELLVSLKLGHQVLSEQKGHDAKDDSGNFYEYKVSQSYSWNFQDISSKVLEKYKEDKSIILAIVDKEQFKVVEIYEAEPTRVVKRLLEKLNEKEARFAENGKELRRLQVSLSKGDLQEISAVKRYPLTE